jgi:hypothetical protein
MPLPNQVYPGPAGEIISVRFVDRTPPPGGLSAVDYNFEVTIDGEVQRVTVRLLNEAIDALEPWINDPANLFRIGEGVSADVFAIEVCTVRILEAIQQGRDLHRLDIVTGPPAPISKAPPTAEGNLTIKDHISQRLYAGWRHCGDSLDCAQKFGRVDWLYLKVSQRDLRKVINQNLNVLWTEVVQGHMYLKATASLITELEQPRRRERPFTPTFLSSPSMSAGKIPIFAAHPTRERVLGATLNGWLEREAERRGRVWAVAGIIAGLVLALLALLIT